MSDYIHKIPLLPADDADAKIQELEDDLADLRLENERLRALLSPAHFVTAPEVILYLDAFMEKLTTYVERQQVRATMAAIRRLQANPNAGAWYCPTLEVVR